MIDAEAVFLWAQHTNTCSRGVAYNVLHIIFSKTWGNWKYGYWSVVISFGSRHQEWVYL